MTRQAHTEITDMIIHFNLDALPNIRHSSI